MVKTRVRGMHTGGIIVAAIDVHPGPNRCHYDEGSSSWGRALNAGAASKLGPSHQMDVKTEEVPQNGCRQWHKRISKPQKSEEGLEGNNEREPNARSY